jgi:hypothetical protein
MKHLFTLVLLFLFASGYSQTDSTNIKLNRIKQLFIDGTINEQEYKEMRANVLGIHTTPPAQPQTIYIQPMNLKAEEEHARNAGGGCLASAILLSMGGSALVIVSHASVVAQTKQYGYVSDTKSVEGTLVAGSLLFSVAFPLWIAGGVEMGKANRYKREMSQPTAVTKIEFSPTAMLLTF